MSTQHFTSAVAMYIDFWNVMRAVCHSHDLSRRYGEESLLLVNASRSTGGVMLTIQPPRGVKVKSPSSYTSAPPYVLRT